MQNMLMKEKHWGYQNDQHEKKTFQHKFISIILLALKGDWRFDILKGNNYDKGPFEQC